MKRNKFVFFRRFISSLTLIFISLGIFGITIPVFKFFSKMQLGQIFVDMSMGTAVYCFFMLLAGSIFGRIYCSMFCPLGVFQDIAGALSKSLVRKKYSYHKRFKLFNYFILALVVMLFMLGVPSLISILDPYSIYVRGASRLLDYILGSVMDIMAPMFKNLSIYSAYSSGNIVLPPVIILILIFFAAFLRGRLFCNTLCPVGMILGCVSRAPTIRPAFKDNCISCGKCETVCKTECISVSNKMIDVNRCVMCGNCAAACPVEAMDFSVKDTNYSHEKREIMKSIASITIFTALPFMKGKKLLSSTIALSAFSKKIEGNGSYPQIPAGAMSWARLRDKCLSCHACIKRCPSKVLVTAGVKFGISGASKPALNFNSGFCQYDCVVCGQTCPFGAIMPISVDEKRMIQTGIAHYNSKLCVITTKRVRCGACAEHCPTGALEMISRESNHDPIPVINQRLCVGCGACQYICPVIPQKAIIVNPLVIHQTAEVLKQPENTNIEEINNDFVF